MYYGIAAILYYTAIVMILGTFGVTFYTNYEYKMIYLVEIIQRRAVAHAHCFGCYNFHEMFFDFRVI